MVIESRKRLKVFSCILLACWGALMLITPASSVTPGAAGPSCFATISTPQGKIKAGTCTLRSDGNYRLTPMLTYEEIPSW